MVRGKGIKRNEVVEKGYPCIRYGEIYTSYNLFFKNSISHVDNGIYNSSKKIRRNDLIYTLTGENKPDIAKTVAYLGEEDIAAGGDLAIWSNHHMNPLYLSYLLSSPYMISNKVKLATGDIIVHISVDKVGSFVAPIPPLKEQNRIVKQMLILEELIKEYSEKEEELYKLNSNIKERLKKSILQYAIEGKLVPQDPNDEPASVLLDRIRKEKQKLIAEGKIKKDKNESIIYRRDNSYYEKLNGIDSCIDDEIPFTIPQKWSWIRLKNISTINMGTSPIGDSISGNNENGFEFHQGKIFFGDKYLNRSNVYTTRPIKFAEENSLLLCVRAPVGKLNITRRNVCIGRGLCTIKPYGNIRTEFLYYFLLTYEKYFAQNSTGSTFKAITSNVIFNCLFPLPSLDEQNKIIKTIEKVYSILK